MEDTGCWCERASEPLSGVSQTPCALAMEGRRGKTQDMARASEQRPSPDIRPSRRYTSSTSVRFVCLGCLRVRGCTRLHRHKHSGCGGMRDAPVVCTFGGGVGTG